MSPHAATPAEGAGRRGVVELGGLGRPGTTTVDLAQLPAHVRIVDSTALDCDPDTGALIAGVVPKSLAPCDRRPPPPDAVEDRYRPSPALQRLIRLRDGHCRFPGCAVNARSCDLDHVIAWPTGPTTATNLICLCRRHHRVKQRPGWTARLDPDGTVHWTDPAGRTTDTHPVDHLDRLHHPAPARSSAVAVASEDDGPRPRPDDHSPGDGGPDAAAPPTTTAPVARPDDPALLPTLLELSLTRLLDLAEADTRPRPPARIDWLTDLKPVMVDVPTASSAAPDASDDPPF